MGATHFLTRTLDKVRTEMSLHVLAYSLKRMITIFGVGPLMAASGSQVRISAQLIDTATDAHLWAPARCYTLYARTRA